jgi:hypothetical protein
MESASTANRSAAYARLALAAALPITGLSLAYLASVAINVGVPHIGWFDRAWFGGTIVLPLMLASPGLAGMARFMVPTRQQAYAVIAVVSLSVAVFATYRIALDVYQVGCEPITSRVQAVPPSLEGSASPPASPSVWRRWARDGRRCDS